MYVVQENVQYLILRQRSSEIDQSLHDQRMGREYIQINKQTNNNMFPKKDEVFVNLCSGRKSNEYVVVVSLVQPFLVPSSPGSEEQLSKLVHPPFWHRAICLSFWQGLTYVTFSWSKDKTASSILGTKANFAFFCFCFFAAFLQSVTRSCLEIMVEIMETSDIARFRNQIFHLKSLSKNQPSYTIAWCQNSWPKS